MHIFSWAHRPKKPHALVVWELWLEAIELANSHGWLQLRLTGKEALPEP